MSMLFAIISHMYPSPKEATILKTREIAANFSYFFQDLISIVSIYFFKNLANFGHSKTFFCLLEWNMDMKDQITT